MKEVVRQIGNRPAPPTDYVLALHADVRHLRACLKAGEDSDYYRALQQPSWVRSSVAILIDWLLIFAAIIAVGRISAYLLPISLVVIGIRQRALANIRHDASHFNLYGNRRVNDWITDLFGSFAMFETVRFYREGHILHHDYLGLNSHDPDAANHVAYGFDDTAPVPMSPLKKFSKLFFNLHGISESVGKSFFEVAKLERLKIVLWWALFLSVIAGAFGVRFAGLFFAVWMLARATAYHAIRIFSDFLDHSGLEPGTTLGFSRTLPGKSPFSFIVSPHDDVYHMTHHVVPKVPHYYLGEVHKILLREQSYRAAHHCESYFFGKHSAWKCWVGQCLATEMK